MLKPTKVAAAVAFSCTDNVVDRDTLDPLLVPPASVSKATSGIRSASRCSVYPTCAHASIGFGVVKKTFGSPVVVLFCFSSFVCTCLTMVHFTGNYT